MSDVTDLVDISTLTPGQLQALQNQILAKQVEMVSVENRQLRREVHEQGARVDELGGRLEDKEEKDSTVRLDQTGMRYYTRTTIGNTFIPSISNQRMSKLLKIVGVISPKHGTPYAPCRQGEEPLVKGIKKASDSAEWTVWMFHEKKLKARINAWLKKNGGHHAFYSLQTTDEIHTFIDNLYKTMEREGKL